MNDSTTIPICASTLIESIREPAILLSPAYRILAANRSYRGIYSHDREIVGKHCFEVSHGCDRPCSELGEVCPMVQARRQKEAQRVLHIHHTPQGDEYVEVEGRPVFDEQSGELLYFVEVIRETRGASARVDEKGMVGRSKAFNRMLELVQRVAPSETTALLLGASGTGKELVAQAIHDLSARRNALFVPVECSGLTESLFESELFGHEKGAFTGAFAAKDGLVEAARGGTLFLDEVGDIPLPLQVKLLRLLETGTYRRVGSVEPRQADFRLICATHRELERMVDEGEFRKDLYYRISTFPIELPSLGERLDDLPLLSETLLKRIKGAETKTLSQEALACLMGYEFPGNIRELRNILERASLMCDGEIIQPEHLPPSCCETPEEVLAGQHDGIIPLDELERRYLLGLVEKYPGDRRALARKLGISERTLFRKLQQFRQ
jgi:two-component system response regulator HydG